MSNRQSVDLELFQTFLANAFAVQESGLDRRSLSAVIEIQRFIANDDFKLDAAMQMIVDRALGVAHASGVAIGLIEPTRNELVYKAGSGSASTDVGRRVPAVLSACSTAEQRREILRVENAASDTRIEAEICRQFGARSLLMLPIYRDGALAGVLQTLFEDAHSFPEREIRAYRLMIGALEEAMARASQRAPETAAVIPIAAIPAHEAISPRVTHIPEPVAESSFSGAYANGTGTDECVRHHTGIAHSGSPRVAWNYAPVFRQWTESLRAYKSVVARELAALQSKVNDAVKFVKTRPLSANFRNASAAIGGALVLSVVVWISHRSVVASGKINLSGSTSRDAQLQPPGKPSFEESTKPLSSGSNDAAASNRGFRRVRVGPNEVDYISDDVTIRKFEPIHPTPQIRKAGKEVNFGDDVTVRYFAKSPALASESTSPSEATPTKKSSRSE